MENKLDRFIHAQDDYGVYEQALSEMKEGRKQSHWMWYIFPQIKGLGHSYNSTYYAIESLFEARHYVDDPILGKRLREITGAVLSHEGEEIEDIMGSDIDSRKFHSSMTLFDMVSPGELFMEALEAFFEGRKDDSTLVMVLDEKNLLYADSALKRHGGLRNGFNERGFFEGGTYESEQIPSEAKLPTMLDLVLRGDRMEDMVRHYLYWKDFSSYRLSGVSSQLTHYCVSLLIELKSRCGEKYPDSLPPKLEAGKIILDRCREGVLEAAETFDWLVQTCKSEAHVSDVLREMTWASLLTES